MKNYLKKIGALLMAVIMVVTMCVTAFAADSETGTAVAARNHCAGRCGWISEN